MLYLLGNKEQGCNTNIFMRFKGKQQSGSCHNCGKVDNQEDSPGTMEEVQKWKKEPHHLIEHVFCTLDVLDSAQFS